MQLHNSKKSYPHKTIIWLYFLVIYNLFLILANYIYHVNLRFEIDLLPYYFFLLLNVYSILLLLRRNKQGFFCLLSLQVILIIYVIITRNIIPYTTLFSLLVNPLLLGITYLLLHSEWEHSLTP